MGLIAVFDFDGTLIKVDSMVLFFRRYYKYSWNNTGILITLVWETIKFFVKINSQKQFKEKFLNIVIWSLKNTGLKEIIPDFSKFLLNKIFKDALRKASYREYFNDMFAGDFGHCTPKGNRLLAENIAKVILKEYFGKLR